LNKYRNFEQRSKFWTKIEILNKDRNFEQRSKFWKKLEILFKNVNIKSRTFSPLCILRSFLTKYSSDFAVKSYCKLLIGKYLFFKPCKVKLYLMTYYLCHIFPIIKINIFSRIFEVLEISNYYELCLIN